MTSSTAWWRARSAWQKVALLLLPVALAAVVFAVVLDPRDSSSVAERPAAEVRPEEPDLSRGLVVFDGCSLVADAGVAPEDGMPAQVMALLPAGLDMKNLGVGGQTTQMMAADAAAEVDPLYDASRGRTTSSCAGKAPTTSSSAPRRRCDARQAYRHLAAYCTARRRAGFRVVICTVLPRGRSAAFYEARNALNAELRAHWSVVRRRAGRRRRGQDRRRRRRRERHDVLPRHRASHGRRLRDRRPRGRRRRPAPALSGETASQPASFSAFSSSCSSPLWWPLTPFSPASMARATGGSIGEVRGRGQWC